MVVTGLWNVSWWGGTRRPSAAGVIVAFPRLSLPEQAVRRSRRSGRLLLAPGGRKCCSLDDESFITSPRAAHHAARSKQSVFDGVFGDARHFRDLFYRVLEAMTHDHDQALPLGYQVQVLTSEELSLACGVCRIMLEIERPSVRAPLAGSRAEGGASRDAIRPSLQATRAAEAVRRSQYLDDAELPRVEGLCAVEEDDPTQAFYAMEQPARDLPLRVPIPARDSTHQLQVSSRVTITDEGVAWLKAVARDGGTGRPDRGRRRIARHVSKKEHRLTLHRKPPAFVKTGQTAHGRVEPRANGAAVPVRKNEQRKSVCV